MAKPILLFDVISEELATDIVNQVLEFDKGETIELWINSPGGSVSAGWSILAALQNHESGFNITVTGDASSMAFIMLPFAENVKAFDTSNFLVHRAASWWEDVMNKDELKDIENRNKIIRKKLELRIDEDQFEQVTGKSFDDIFSMDDRLNVRLNARQAKKIGLVNEVVKLNVKKREEIEAQYFNSIAALATSQKKEISNNNNNSNNNNMGLFSKEPVYLCIIGESQFAYNKLEVKAKIKAIGDGEKEPVSGTFEANNKKVTVVADVITAIEDIDTKQDQINALSEKIEALTAQIAEATKKEPVKADIEDKSEEQIIALTAKVDELTAVLDKAKITKSSPDLPKGEFKEEIINDDLSTREKMTLEQNAMHEAKLKEREN